MKYSIGFTIYRVLPLKAVFTEMGCISVNP